MKKRIIKLLIIVVIITLCVIIIKIFSGNTKKTIICIDAGHGGTDVGAESNGRYEKNDTLKVAKKVKEILEKEDNIKVIMTRDEDKAVSLEQRCHIANKNKAKIFVSIHRNSAEKTANGIEIWLDKNKEKEDTELAENILNELKKQEIQTDRGIKYGTIKGENTNYYVLGNTNMPSCLVELGFITNEKDNNLLDKNLENYANAIASGILKKVKE